ncbi:hypothetical protein BST61_g10693 [Cercospora zeina]
MAFEQTLVPVTGYPWVRDQIFANAVALYPHLVTDEARALHSNSGQLDPKAVFQILTSFQRGGWQAILVYGVPTIEGVLIRGKSKGTVMEALNRLLYAISEMLAVRCRIELHIPGRSRTSVTDHGTFNKDYL